MLPDHQARLEDLRWLTETGEHADGAARRLGLTFTTLEAWARKNAPDLWAVLLARRPRDWNCRTGFTNGRGAA